MIRIRQDWAERAISDLRKGSLRDCENISKLDGRAFKLESDLIGATSATKLLECDIKLLRERVDKLSKTSKEKQTHLPSQGHSDGPPSTA